MLHQPAEHFTGAGTYGRRPAARDVAALAQAHMPLVRRIAWHVHGRVSSAVDVEDLIQVGMVALVEAAQAFEDRGHAFSTYASMRIRGSMIDELRRHATMARGAMVRRRELAATRRTLEATLGREASEPEMAAALGLDAAAYRTLADGVQAVRHESLDEVYSDQSMWFADLEEAADDALDRQALGALLADGIAKLPEREAMVLQLYFVEELNLEEIGQVLGVTNARICQIKKAALDKLRTGLKDRR